MHKLSLCTFALCLGFASITHAQATVTKTKFKGSTVIASALSGDDPCITAGFGLSASDQVSKDANGTTTTKELDIGYSGSDACNMLSFGGDATLPLTVPIAGVTTITFPFDITISYLNSDTGERFTKRLTGSITITANGDFEKSRRTDISQTEVLRTVTRSKGNTREATVTITAKLDGVPQSLPITEGEIGTVKNGTREVTRF